jgi:hypothetical protein
MTNVENSKKPDAVCTRCGKYFTCGMTSGLQECWCMKRPVLPLDLPLKPGEGGHGQCLCPECFDRLSVSETLREHEDGVAPQALIV